MSFTGDRLFNLPTPPRSFFVYTARLPVNRACTGGVAFVSAVGCCRVLSLTQPNPIVSNRRRLVPVRALDSDFPHPNKEYEERDSWTAKFSGGANVPFLMLQLPQIILNAQNLLAGNNAALSAVPWLMQARTGKLSEEGVRFVGSLSGWTATLMFMWMPVSQMWTNFLNPENIKGLSPITMVLAMMGNGLMIPRALYIRDLMWFTGSMWATLFYGYGNILCLYMLNCTSKSFFAAATIGLISWIGLALWRDTIAYGHKSPFRSLKELVFRA